MITKLKNGKATGLHNLPNKVLKLSRYYISSSLADIFNASIKTRIFPDDFKLGKITPIYKTGDKDDPGNYGPISVLPSASRLFEKVLYDQLYDYFAKNKPLGDGQWRFRSLHSTALALSQCTNDWIIHIDRGDMSNAVFLDIQEPWRLPSRQAEFDETDRLSLMPHSDYQAMTGNQGHFELKLD